MKKILIPLLALAVIAGFVYAQTTVTNKGVVFEVTTMTDLADSTETTPITDVTVANLTQVDSATTTTATDYTPAYAGQVLLGGAGVGTNAVWIAKGTTTNDWVQVTP